LNCFKNQIYVRRGDMAIRARDDLKRGKKVERKKEKKKKRGGRD